MGSYDINYLVTQAHYIIPFNLFSNDVPTTSSKQGTSSLIMVHIYSKYPATTSGPHETNLEKEACMNWCTNFLYPN